MLGKSRMNKERYIQQFRSDLIYAKADRCKTPQLAKLEDSLMERCMGIATLGGYQAIKTTKIYHSYNKEHRDFLQCIATTPAPDAFVHIVGSP